MQDIGSLLSSIELLQEEVSKRLIDENLDYPGPESGTDCSVMAKVWEHLRVAEQEVAGALDELTV